jgi:phytoene dehydrogenase-like protein
MVSYMSLEEQVDKDFSRAHLSALLRRVGARLEKQIERFASGFKERILAKSISGPAELERQNANLVGGDITGGYIDLRQIFARPMIRLNPYSTSAKGLYICSSSTPPGGSVHGLCGYFAARAALRGLKRGLVTGA